MAQTDSLTLSIQTDEFNRFCEKLIRRSRDISKTHDAINTLDAFITTFSGASSGTEAQHQVKTILNSFSESTRQQLLSEKTELLIQALMNADIEQMTEVHHCLSRNGFYQVLEAALSKLPQDALLNAKTRCNDWLNLAKQKAEQASGYPEAYDFKKAGIDIHQFQALKDVSHFLNSKS